MVLYETRNPEMKGLDFRMLGCGLRPHHVGSGHSQPWSVGFIVGLGFRV